MYLDSSRNMYGDKLIYSIYGNKVIPSPVSDNIASSLDYIFNIHLVFVELG
jgi:hypothetical protein